MVEDMGLVQDTQPVMYRVCSSQTGTLEADAAQKGIGLNDAVQSGRDGVS
jgi:hypothetical protein